MDKKAIMGMVVVLVILFGLLGSCAGESDYEKAGNSFGDWVNTDPNRWTDTQKDYFDNFMDWAGKN